MECVMFLVHERPLVYWDSDLSGKNLEFLRGMDPAYYEHVVAAHAPHLANEAKLQAAAAIRVAYSQGLETLLALICAAMQAPTCVVGWMQSYKNWELSKMVKGISSGPRPEVLPGFRPASWNTMAEHVHSCSGWEDDRKDWTQRSFGRLWSRFADEYMDDKGTQEYNALKHGTRPRLGGFSMSFGLQPAEGVPASPKAMMSMGGSEFGSTFFVSKRIGAEAIHFWPHRVSRNWDPVNMANGLLLLAMSIRNVIAFLRFVNGDSPDEREFAAPLEEKAFDLPWARVWGVTSSSMDTVLTVDDIRLWTKDEVLAALRRKSSS